MLRVALDGGGQGQRFLLAYARVAWQIVGGGHARHAEPPLGQGAGLVKDDRVDLARFLQRQPVADQHAIAGGYRGRDGHDQGHGQPQRVGTGDDQHRGHPGDDVHIKAHGHDPAHGGQGGYRQGDVKEPARGPVGQDLRV